MPCSSSAAVSSQRAQAGRLHVRQQSGRCAFVLRAFRSTLQAAVTRNARPLRAAVTEDGAGLVTASAGDSGVTVRTADTYTPSTVF